MNTDADVCLCLIVGRRDAEGTVFNADLKDRSASLQRRLCSTQRPAPSMKMLQIIDWEAAARWNTHSHFETLIHHNKLGTLIAAFDSFISSSTYDSYCFGIVIAITK